VRTWFAVAVLVTGLGGTMACAGARTTLEVPPQTSDTGITDLINRRFAMNQRLCPYEITVVVYNRTVRLDGKVAGDAERRQAERVARDAGALQVDDQLTIDPSAGDAGRC
jgi:osmotically-inducible protein OsmY